MLLTIKEGLTIIQSCLDDDDDDDEDGQGYLFDFFKGPRGKGLLKLIENQGKQDLELMHKYMLLQGCQLPEEMAELLRIKGVLRNRFVEVGIVTLSKDF